MLGPIAGSVKGIAWVDAGMRAASGGEMPRGGEARQRVGKLFAIQRLDQKTVHSGSKQA